MGQIRSTLLDIETLTLIGNWAAADRYMIGEENSLLIQSRANGDIHIARERNGPNYWTIKAGRELIVPCFNSEGQTIYFRGTPGDILEILRQHDI